MTRGLIRGIFFALLASATLVTAQAALPPDSSAPSPLLERFLSLAEPSVVEYRAVRHLEAQNDRFNSSAWMDVWTEMSRDGAFSYRIAGQGEGIPLGRQYSVVDLDGDGRLDIVAPSKIGLWILHNEGY